MDAQNLINQINDVTGEIRFLIDKSKTVYNNLDLSVISGPYARSRAYSLAKRDNNCRVFKFHDFIDEYYIVDYLDAYGQRLYDDLWSKRSLLNRLRKELVKI